jgi:hypothetical protein
MNQPADFLDPKRTVAELKKLRALTGDDDGVQRVAFTKTWAKARDWMDAKMAELPVEAHKDAGIKAKYAAAYLKLHIEQGPVLLAFFFIQSIF